MARSLEKTHLWDIKTGQLVLESDHQKPGLGSVAFSPDGLRFAASGLGCVSVWSAMEAKP